ncbi:Hypothetical predicted protein [Octopus vulgaris]|uniref:Uncharacterized protein n=1 Tax=Octopus vulgaris TaxID=6645 RepID=A0AA36B9Z1_OCTVU|nr:Hypothetical predicted protein [Octopus vulgaris]
MRMSFLGTCISAPTKNKRKPSTNITVATVTTTAIHNNSNPCHLCLTSDANTKYFKYSRILVGIYLNGTMKYSLLDGAGTQLASCHALGLLSFAKITAR